MSKINVHKPASATSPLRERAGGVCPSKICKTNITILHINNLFIICRRTFFFANGVNDKVYEMICKSYEAFGNTEEDSLAKDYHHDTPDLNCDLIKHPEDSYCDSILRDTSL